MDKNIMYTIKILVGAVLVFQLAGCGTIMYPERKGQKSGKIDAGVAILDGIGLLFFLIPGVIAFAVDFNNGTIYLPGTYRSSLDIQDIRQVKFSPKDSPLPVIERLIKEQTGTTVKLNLPNVHITKLMTKDDMLEKFSEHTQRVRDNQIVFVR